MKNTEYKDVFDIGEEVLSMENKFSFPSMQKAFSIGENIRGMNNVSPLATVKLFNQSVEDLQMKYYPDGSPPLEGTFAYISDNNSDLTPVIKTTVKDFYYYGVKDVKNFAFKVIIFSSTEATKLKECFEVSNPKGREILIFVEDNSTDSVSGTYGAIKISNDVLSFLNSKNRLAYDVYDNNEIYKEIKAVVPELSDDQIQSLLRNGFIEDYRVDIAKTYFKVASFFSSGISLIHPSLGILTNDALRATTSTVLEKIIQFIEAARLEENRWQPDAPELENGEIDKNYKYSPIISSGKNEDGSINFTIISRYLKAMLTEQNDFVKLALNIRKDFKHDSQPKGLLEILYKSYLDAYYIMHDIASNLESLSEIEILKYGTKVYNAILCGIWNGLIDSISALFSMIKMVYDGITLGKDFAKNIEKYLPALLEQFDETIQAIKNLSFTEIVTYIYTKLKKIKLTFDPIACGYFLGYIYGFIISLIIEIIVGTLISGGALDIPIIIQKLEETILGIFRLGWSIVKGVALKIRTFSKFVVKSIKNLIEGFQELITFLKKGWPEIKKVIDESFEGVSLLRRGRYIGQVLEEADFLLIERFLKNFKVDFQLGKGKGIVEIDGYFYPSGNVVTLKPNEAAMFITDGISMKFVIRENATTYEVLHELMHFRDCMKLGKEKFLNKPLVDREKYVYDKIIEYRKYVNRRELKHAEGYINYHFKKVGKTDKFGNPIIEVLPFDANNIPKKRQKVNVNEILNLK
ncbi:zincin-like metallopeptidase toxin domain-containing protein [uncultured Chryseobacterium sp.]|uniref:zincin-like metallopeptidase toxin domain-containing protein n=1 Tax=uncultured Chryseobacterium sp. TaxID=259322 RepID=UPI0025838DCA|nr:zincin-like metallopeptidase toxin domain-containing protein [uncultured Chryseobacterium sp.]